MSVFFGWGKRICFVVTNNLYFFNERFLVQKKVCLAKCLFKHCWLRKEIGGLETKLNKNFSKTDWRFESGINKNLWVL